MDTKWVLYLLFGGALILYVGIDVAKNKHDVTVLDGTGKQVLKTITFTNRKQGFEWLHNTLKQLGQDCLIAMEDTGHYALNFLKFLYEKAYQVYTYNPLLIKEFTKSLSLRKTKTDKKDAQVIALKLVTDPNRELFKNDDKQEELKILTRHITRLKRHQTDWKVQYTKCLDSLFPEFHQAVTKHSDYSYELLKAFPAPEKMIGAGFQNLMDIKRLTVKHAQDTLELASNTIGTTSPAREFELVQIIENIQHYEKLIKQANHKIDELMAEINSVIVSVPGISNRLGSVILAEIRNINTFNNPAQLQAFAGLEPSIYQSGQIDTKGKMVKRGSTHLRWALLQAAIKVARYSPAFKAYFRTKLAQGKHYNVAMSHVAKKLIRVLFYLKII